MNLGMLSTTTTGIGATTNGTPLRCSISRIRPPFQISSSSILVSLLCLAVTFQINMNLILAYHVSHLTQAYSHYTWIKSGKKLLVCDIQVLNLVVLLCTHHRLQRTQLNSHSLAFTQPFALRELATYGLTLKFTRLMERFDMMLDK
jgi:hypothetical protein